MTRPTRTHPTNQHIPLIRGTKGIPSIPKITSRKLLAVTVLLLAAAAPAARAQIIIGPGEPPCEVDPTQDKCREPVLIIPGLGASYNRRLMLQDRDGGEWEFAPSVDWFDALIERLQREGYVLNRNLFIVHYDWRQRNLESAIEYLIPAIQHALDLNDPESGKVDIIAHSMGGLAARAYAQSENLYNDDVDQLILIGTPNGGTAGAYVAWEGGDFPQNWGFLSRQWMLRIDRSLRKTHDVENERPPLSFRRFFPSLKELLPITPFVSRDGTTLNPDQVAEQNNFLQNLEDTSDRLAARGIEVTTIAGDDLSTLAAIPVTIARTPEDVTLERWRDGHASPDPPQADSTAGDQTVLKESAQRAGAAHITRDNVSHESLPGQAQSEIANLLLEAPAGDFIPQHLASAAVGIDILSPVQPAVTGPNGEVLSADTNTFPNADFDWDAAEPDGIKVLTITDPPPGEYAIELTGLAAGDYTVIITYADGDETFSSEHTDATTPGERDELRFTIGELAGKSITIEVADLRDLLRYIIDLAEAAHRDKLIKGHQRASLTRPAHHALKDLKLYERRLGQNRADAAADRLADYYGELDELAAAISRLPRTPALTTVVDELTAQLARIRALSPMP